MKHRTNQKGKAATFLALLMLLSVFSGCVPQDQAQAPSQAPSQQEETASAATDATLVTEPAPTTPADGNPGDVTCKGSYTVDASAAEAAGDSVVASITYSRTELVENPEATEAPEETTEAGATEAPEDPDATEPPAYIEVTTTEEAALTNSQLQVWYWLEVAEYRQAGHESAPDFTKALDTQVCQIDDTVGSWQQYFLREALNSWAAVQALAVQSTLEPLPTEEAYQPNAEKHAEYFVDIPASSVYYGSSASYQPNSLHQAYLDAVPTTLEELASALAYANAEDMVLDLMGPGASTESLTQYTQLYNLGYMYLTELGYDFSPTAEDVDAFFTENEAAYAAAGITRDSGRYVDMRHILLIPRDATVADDGTVTASEDAWRSCRYAAESILYDFYNGYPVTESGFADIVAEESADPASAHNGGLYQHLTQGQLTEALDTWLFDDDRTAGDTAVIRSDCGYHVVYFCGSTDIWYDAAETDLTTRLYQDLFTAALEKYPAQIDYSAISLGAAEMSGQILTPDQLLYPDVAHERFPEVPLYLQQDYPNTMYGAYPIVTHGCGITTMAMLATYMTDTELTPPMLCARYGRYCTKKGSDRTLYKYPPAEMGFYLKKQVFNAKEAYAALEQGYPVVCLQHEGFWTRGGHFLMLEKLNENGTIQVRDSNIYNYSKLEGHKIDEFDWSTIPTDAISFWIFEKKVTTCSECTRCGDGVTDRAPDAMFAEEYLCRKCANALIRRDAYLNN